MNQLDIKEITMKTVTISETDLYADKELTMTEAIAVVRGKLAANIPVTGAKEELAKEFIEKWSDSFGFLSVK